MADYVTHIKTAPGTESVPFQDPNAVQRTGDTMAADLSMGGFRLTNVEEPELDTDAANKKYVDAMLSKDGGTMSGAIDMGSNQITNLADPTDDADAVNKKYVDGASPKWGLVGSWGYGETLTADFTAYDELMFVCDFSGDGFTDYAGGSIHIPTACLAIGAGSKYFAVMTYGSTRFCIKMTTAEAETYSVLYNGSSISGYTIYCYGR